MCEGLGAGIKTRRGTHRVRPSAPQAGTSRARPPVARGRRSDAGRPGRTPAGPGRASPGRGVARRGGPGPRSLAEHQALPLLSCVQTKPGGDSPEALRPQGPGLRPPQLPAAGGWSPGPGEEAVSLSAGRSWGRWPEGCGPEA